MADAPRGGFGAFATRKHVAACQLRSLSARGVLDLRLLATTCAIKALVTSRSDASCATDDSRKHDTGITVHPLSTAQLVLFSLFLLQAVVAVAIVVSVDAAASAAVAVDAVVAVVMATRRSGCPSPSWAAW
jgi:hypothetical protein